LKIRHAEVDGEDLRDSRNVLVHDYLGINVARLWRIVSTDLPVLKKQGGRDSGRNWPGWIEGRAVLLPKPPLTML
jgi:hypothetical protein